MDSAAASAPLREAPPAADVDTVGAALQDPTRRRILLALVHDGEARTVDEVAAVAGVHRTVAFGHLEKLLALGCLTKQQRRGRPGKPASLYAARRPVALSYPPRQFQLLASLLGEGLNDLGEQGPRLARERGRRYGAAAGRGPATTVPAALQPLESLGGGYLVDGDDVSATSCVFREACDAAREVVCSLHAGVLEGALGAAGISATVQPRGPVSRGGCHFGVAAPAHQKANS